MRGSTRHAVCAIFTAFSCALLFSIAMLLRYKVYRDSSTSLTSTDLVPITKRVSSVWCSSQTLKARGNSAFEVFLVSQDPPIIQGGQHRTFSHYSELRVATVEYWGFYLHKGSTINISTCARLPGATLTVIRGQRLLSDCLRRFHRSSQDTSEESEESVGDDEGPSSSISSSEGVFTSEATEEGAFHCPQKSLFHTELQAVFSCSNDLIVKGRTLRFLNSVELSVDESDYHYVLFSTGAILDLIPNQVHWSIRLDRTTLDLSSSLSNCSQEVTCEVTLPFASAHYAIVHMLDNPNGSVPVSDVIVSTCEPRKGLYFVFFLLIFLAIGLCAFQ